MKKVFIASCILSGVVLSAGGAHSAASAMDIDSNDIGGVVKGPKGPEAGVWVIAETADLATPFIKIVVTDDAGRYVLPDLPKATYKVWVRGYGLSDSKPIPAAMGKLVDLSVQAAPSAAAAAQIYPANYWLALIRPPAENEFPGSGPSGNGISPGMGSQQEWMAHMKEQCHYCHQLGDKATRELATTGNSLEAWDHRVQMARAPGDVTLGDRGKELASQMNNNMTRYGRQRGLRMFADWSDRVAKGELPPSAPPRPRGVERNVVLSMWDWGGGHFVHDEIATDKRVPTINANGLIYGTDDMNGHLILFDPLKHETSKVPIPGGPDQAHNRASGVHNPMVDDKGRVWLTRMGSPSVVEAVPPFCSDGVANKFAKTFPMPPRTGRSVGVFDPKTRKFDLIPVCFGTHHLQFASDKDNTLYFSGDNNVMSWINTRVYDETRDPAKSSGWCPMVLDTNGDGKTNGGRNDWNEPNAPVDPKKDTRITSFLYGLGVSPKDGSIWFAKFEPSLPSGIVRFEPGNNPPETCRTEYFEPPRQSDGKFAAYNTRGVDIDSQGIAWVAFGSGQVGRFDRSKCKTLKGPTATGQHCPEGWTLYDSDGPKVAGTSVGTADWHYLTWVDWHDVFGLGKDVAIIPGSNSDSLLARLPDSGKEVIIRVPYPMGFYTRGLDGRIDDPAGGWKGRGLWASYGTAPLWHTETGEGASSKLIKFQLRPDPLAH